MGSIRGFLSVEERELAFDVRMLDAELEAPGSVHVDSVRPTAWSVKLFV
jgi:hypothetical protein